MKFVIVGCGLSGCVAARLLKDQGHNIIIYDTRDHIAGNCFDTKVSNVLTHKYGSHIFHTDDEKIFNFFSRFTEWTDFKLQPIGNTALGKIPLPYHDQGCIKSIGRILSQEEIVEYIFKDYSEKQWGVPFNQIPKTITNRIPKTKFSSDPTWFEGQKYQCIPTYGYTELFQNMIEGIPVILNSNSNDWKKTKADKIIYTGKIDEYFNYKYGKLSYRSLRFENKVSSKKMPYFIQNECNKKNNYTRVYDQSYFNTNFVEQTIITKEYPKACEDGDIPFYPIPWGVDQRLYSKYEELAKKETNVYFIGRLATYKYLDMWMAAKQVFLKLKNYLGVI